MDTTDRIQEELASIEASEEVVILYACESGSRAWGFASTDSDYDVRFIYTRKQDWYLDIDLEHKRDVIEKPITDVLDVSGWDIRKALRLFRKSNPPLLEWLGSPIVYREKPSLAPKLRELTARFYSPIACGYHYLHMAEGNYREHLRGEIVWRKKYFYVLRPLLAIRWIEADRGVVPTEFDELLRHTIDSIELKTAIQALLKEKASGGELDRGPRVPEISDFIDDEFRRLEGTEFRNRPEFPKMDVLNDLFREVLRATYDEAR